MALSRRVFRGEKKREALLYLFHHTGVGLKTSAATARAPPDGVAFFSRTVSIAGCLFSC
jgi:hypothetical protein